MLDCGPQFASKFAHDICQVLSIEFGLGNLCIGIEIGNALSIRLTLGDDPVWPSIVSSIFWMNLSYTLHGTVYCSSPSDGPLHSTGMGMPTASNWCMTV